MDRGKHQNIQQTCFCPRLMMMAFGTIRTDTILRVSRRSWMGSTASHNVKQTFLQALYCTHERGPCAYSYEEAAQKKRRRKRTCITLHIRNSALWFPPVKRLNVPDKRENKTDPRQIVRVGAAQCCQKAQAFEGASVFFFSLPLVQVKVDQKVPLKHLSPYQPTALPPIMLGGCGGSTTADPVTPAGHRRRGMDARCTGGKVTREEELIEEDVEGRRLLC